MEGEIESNHKLVPMNVVQAGVASRAQSVVHVHVLFYLRKPCVMIDVCKAAPVLLIRVVLGAVQVVLGVVWVLLVVVRAVMGVVRVVQ